MSNIIPSPFNMRQMREARRLQSLTKGSESEIVFLPQKQVETSNDFVPISTISNSSCWAISIAHLKVIAYATTGYEETELEHILAHRQALV